MRLFGEAGACAGSPPSTGIVRLRAHVNTPGMLGDQLAITWPCTSCRPEGRAPPGSIESKSKAAAAISVSGHCQARGVRVREAPLARCWARGDPKPRAAAVDSTIRRVKCHRRPGSGERELLKCIAVTAGSLTMTTRWAQWGRLVQPLRRGLGDQIAGRAVAAPGVGQTHSC